MFAKLRKGGGWDHLERWLDGLAAHKTLAEVAAAHAPKGRAAKAEEKSASGRGGGGASSASHVPEKYSRINQLQAQGEPALT